MSNHLPILTMLKQTKLWDSEPITFNSRCLDDKKLKQVNANLMKIGLVYLMAQRVMRNLINLVKR